MTRASFEQVKKQRIKRFPIHILPFSQNVEKAENKMRKKWQISEKLNQLLHVVEIEE